MTLQHLRHSARRSAAVAIAALALLASAAQADTVTIDFDTSALLGETFSSPKTIGDFVLSGVNTRVARTSINTGRPSFPDLGDPGCIIGGDLSFCLSTNAIEPTTLPGGELTITSASGTPFQFESLLGLNVGSAFAIAIVVEGILGGKSIGSESLSVAPEGGWETLTASTLSGKNLDTLTITLPGAPLTGARALVDDITLTSVPLPAAAWLFGSALMGVAGIGYRNRRRDAV